MRFTAVVEGEKFPIEFDEAMLEEAEDFFRKMDADMDRGYQMSREWVDNPDLEQRCQIAADKILTALHTENKRIAAMMAAYICKRMPGATGVRLAVTGEMMEHDIVMGEPM